MESNINLKVNLKADNSDYVTPSSSIKSKSSSDFKKVYNNYNSSKKNADNDERNVTDDSSALANKMDEVKKLNSDDNKTAAKTDAEDSKLKDTKEDTVKLDEKSDDKDKTKTTKSQEQMLAEIISLLYVHNLEESYSGDASDGDIDQNTLKSAMNGNVDALNALAASLKKNNSALEDILKKLSQDDKLSAQVKSIIQQYFKSKDSQKASLNPADILAAVADQIKSEEGTTAASDLKEFANAILSAFSGNSTKVQVAKGNSTSSLAEMLMKFKLEQSTENVEVQANTPANSDASESNNSGSKNHSNAELTESYSKSDDDVLSDFLKDNSTSDNKSSKVSMFMNMLKTDSKEAQTVAKAEQVVTVNKNTLVNDVVKSLKYMETNNLKELTVKINPKELGELTISVTMEAGKLKADITAQNRDSYNLLMANIAEIKENAASSVKFQDVNVNIYNGDTTFFKDDSQKQNEEKSSNAKSSNTFKKINDDESEDTLQEINDESNINVLA
ncbi:flagellar hook-length control protein FliK [Clostridium oryzae]|uniref:Flagellar hook-length control protein FliK n=1 Tax=Clostridium oryzae TaxID=1450648 RepID=A0A1V4IU17_9CLOT|nr:flagellar hook-length control protein FliK [Clostridium oryzae]OPJ63274.1 flagellar hook-length control protein FliK [Clostridium oryzae]